MPVKVSDEARDSNPSEWLAEHFADPTVLADCRSAARTVADPAVGDMVGQECPTMSHNMVRMVRTRWRTLRDASRMASRMEFLKNVPRGTHIPGRLVQLKVHLKTPVMPNGGGDGGDGGGMNRLSRPATLWRDACTLCRSVCDAWEQGRAGCASKCIGTCFLFEGHGGPHLCEDHEAKHVPPATCGTPFSVVPGTPAAGGTPSEGGTPVAGDAGTPATGGTSDNAPVDVSAGSGASTANATSVWLPSGPVQVGQVNNHKCRRVIAS